MQFKRAAAIASRAANAAFRAAGGPREFTWLQVLSPSEGGLDALASVVAADHDLAARELYARAVAGQGAKPWADVPLALQVACEVFAGAFRELLPRVEHATRAEAAARPQSNVLLFTGVRYARNEGQRA